MSTNQTKAQRLAYLIDRYCPPTNATNKAAAMLVRQDELLRQALEALEDGRRYAKYLMMTQTPFDDAITAIRNHLEGK